MYINIQKTSHDVTSFHPARRVFFERFEPRPQNPHQFREGTKGADAEWSRETQNKLASDLHREAKQKVDALKDHLFVEVKRGDTLGALAKGLSGKLDWGMLVDYRSEKINTDRNVPFRAAQPQSLSANPMIYPGQYVWIENGVIIVSDTPPPQKDIVPPTLPPVIEAPPIAVAPPVQPEGGGVVPPTQSEDEVMPLPPLIINPSQLPPAQTGNDGGGADTLFYALPGAAARAFRENERMSRQPMTETVPKVRQAAIDDPQARTPVEHARADSEARAMEQFNNDLARETKMTPEHVDKAMARAVDAVRGAKTPAEVEAKLSELAAHDGEFARVMEAANRLSGGLALLRSIAARLALKGVVVAGSVGLWQTITSGDSWTGWGPHMDGWKPQSGNKALDTAAYFVPFAGNLLDFADMRNEIVKGNYGAAALNAASGTIGMALDIGMFFTFGATAAPRAAAKAGFRASIAALKNGGLREGISGVGRAAGGAVDGAVKWAVDSRVGRGINAVREAAAKPLNAILNPVERFAYDTVGKHLEGSTAGRLLSMTASGIYDVLTLKPLRNVDGGAKAAINGTRVDEQKQITDQSEKPLQLTYQPKSVADVVRIFNRSSQTGERAQFSSEGEARAMQSELGKHGIETNLVIKDGVAELVKKEDASKKELTPDQLARVDETIRKNDELIANLRGEGELAAQAKDAAQTESSKPRSAAEEITGVMDAMARGAKEAAEKRVNDLVAKDGHIDFRNPESVRQFAESHPDWKSEKVGDATRFTPPDKQPISRETLDRNSRLTGEGRIREAERVLGRKMNEAEGWALFRAHDVGARREGAGIGNYTQAEKIQKGLRLMREGGFTRDEAQRLLDLGLAGKPVDVRVKLSPEQKVVAQKFVTQLEGNIKDFAQPVRVEGQRDTYNVQITPDRQMADVLSSLRDNPQFTPEQKLAVAAMQRALTNEVGRQSVPVTQAQMVVDLLK